MAISFIIPTFNSEEHIGSCVRSIIDKCLEEKAVFEILVVDNGSSDKTRDILDSFGDRIIKILLEKNCGTTYPRNLALKRAGGDIICFLDSDAVLKKGNLRHLCDRLVSTSDIGILAPKLVLSDGSTQRSAKKFPSVLHKFFKLKKIFFGIEPKQNEHYKNLPVDKEVTVDSAISACWFFRKDLIETAGYLDEKIFYSPEDLDYCLRIWKTGKSVVYYPYLEVLHHTQRISHRKKRILLSHIISTLYYFTKHKYLFKPPKYGECNKCKKYA